MQEKHMSRLDELKALILMDIPKQCMEEMKDLTDAVNERDKALRTLGLIIKELENLQGPFEAANANKYGLLCVETLKNITRILIDSGA
jgi:hypothetical protein